MNIALPSAQHALGFANSDRQWVVTAYALAFAISAALFGLGTVLAIVLLPSRQRLEQLRNAASTATVAPPAGEADTVPSRG